MAGILDKKSRFIDYKLSVDGRSQLANNDIRFVYASFSDKSILYEKDYEISKEIKFDVSLTQNYLPLESSPKNYFEINKEFDLKMLYNTSLGKNFNFNDFEKSKSLAENLSSLSLISNRKRINSNEFKLNNSGLLKNTFDFSMYLNDTGNIYPSLKSRNVNVNSLSTIAFDKRFSHKNNAKQLIPIGTKNQLLYNEENFANFEKSLAQNKGGLGFLTSKISKFISIDDANNRERSILNALEEIDKIGKIERNVFELTEYSENVNVLFEMFEVLTEGGEEKLNSLHFIDLGEIYDSSSKSSKHIYLIGKIINSRGNFTNNENASDNKDLSTLYLFNPGEINSSSNIEIALTSYFSFISSFIFVVE